MDELFNVLFNGLDSPRKKVHVLRVDTSFAVTSDYRTQTQAKLHSFNYKLNTTKALLLMYID